MLAGALAAAPMVVSQDLEPRSSTNVPVGETFLVAGVVTRTGDDFDTYGIGWVYRL